MTFRTLAGAVPLLALAALAVARSDPPLAPSAGPTRMATDAVGRMVSIDLPYRGSAFLAPVVADYLFVTRQPDTVLTNPGQWSLAGHLLAQVYPDVLTKPMLPRGGGRAGAVESLLRLHPSAVFAWYFQAPALRRIGLPVVAVGTPGGEPSVLAAARAYAEVLGQYRRAGAIEARYRCAMAETVEERAALLPLPNPKVLAIGFFSGGRIIAWGKGNPFVRLLAIAGVDNATAASNPAMLDTEHVLTLDPDAIILRPSLASSASPSPAAFMQEPRWQGLGAVAARRVYRMPEGGSVYFGGVVEDPLLVRWAAELLHPDLQPRLRTMMRATYARELGIAVSDANLDAILDLAANDRSAGYARFTAQGKGE